MNKYIITMMFFIIFVTDVFSDEITVDDPTWNVAYTLYFTPDTEMYLVKGKPYNGTLVQNDEYFYEFITVKNGFAVKDSSIYYIDKKAGKRYCTDVETTTDSVDMETVVYENASYVDKKDLRTGKGTSVYTEGGKICMTAIYDDLGYAEYGKCNKQDWFDELLE